MNTEEIIGDIKLRFGKKILGSKIKNNKRVTISIEPDILTDIAGYLFNNMGYRFIIASALYNKKSFEIYYHFSYDSTGLILNLHVDLEVDKPEIQSLSNMFNASNWIEREMHELFGINFLNHPNQEKLISEGNWAEGVYPFRDDVK